MKKIAAVCSVLVGLGSAASAHPHFSKTVTAKLPSGVEATITYNTTPANEVRATEAPVGTFVTPRRPVLKLSAALETGRVTVPAGAAPASVLALSSASERVSAVLSAMGHATARERSAFDW